MNRTALDPSERVLSKEVSVNTRLALVVTPLLAACTVVESPIAATLPADGLRRVEANLDRGDFVYTATAPHEVQVRGTAWGRAGDTTVAQDRLEGVWFAAERQGSAALVSAGATTSGAGADLRLAGPATLGLSVAVGQGDVEVVGLRGHIVATADRVRITDAVGSADLYADWGGVTAELVPGPGEVVRIEAEGDIDLTLPWGMPYDLQVWGDPEQQVIVEDLGFQYVMQDGPYLAAYAGSGSVRVDVIARGGDVRVQPMLSW